MDNVIIDKPAEPEKPKPVEKPKPLVKSGPAVVAQEEAAALYTAERFMSKFRRDMMENNKRPNFITVLNAAAQERFGKDELTKEQWTTIIGN